MLPVLAASCGCARASVSLLQTHSCLWLQGRGVSCGSSQGAGARCCPCSKEQTRALGGEGGSLHSARQPELPLTCPSRMLPSSWSQSHLPLTFLSCPAEKSSGPCQPLTGLEAAVWDPWSCPPLQAEKALVLQSFLTGKCCSHSHVGLLPLSCCDLSKFPTRNRPQTGLSDLMGAE